ncbi:MAG: TIM barrel protein [Planctomycetota bacterium]|nr:TIM barrel protein [Planctomycetota bacterium]
MRFAQSSAVYFNYSLQHAITDLHSLGYDGIEIWGGRPHMYRHDLDGQMDEIVTLLRKCDMRICNFIPAQFRYPSVLCSDNETVRADSVAYIKDAIDNAAKVGSPAVSLCPGMTLFDRDVRAGWKQLARSFSEIAEYNQDKGLELLIEPAHRFESNLILTIEDCLRMLDELGSDSFGVLLDTGHCHVNGEDFRRVVPLCKDRPLHVHLDDNDGRSDAHLIPGEGSVDFAALAEALDGIGYDGFISAELGGAYIMDPTAACAETLTILRKMFG